MKKEEFRSAFKEVVAKSLEPSICKVMEVLSSNFEAGVECGIKIGIRLSVDIACGLLDSMTEGRLGDRFIDDFRNLMEKEICEK